MNAKQTEIVARLRNHVETGRGHNSDYSAHEVKRFEVCEDYAPAVYVMAETGRVGDEDTMASVFARDTHHWAIGVRGGLKESTKNARSGKSRFRPASWYHINH